MNLAINTPSWQVTSEEMDATMRMVAEYTGMDAQAQRMLMMESGFQWLEQFTGNDPQAMHHIPRTKQFWGFWKLTWWRMDRNFVRHIHKLIITGRLERDDITEMVLEYEAMHRIEESNKNLYNDEVERNYHSIIQKLKY